MFRFILLSGLIILVLLTSLSLAEIPKMINYQGMLTDNSGNPLTDTLNITFKIYDDPTAGNKKWEETQSSVPVINGLFNVILGSVTPIDTLSFNQDYWLDITVGAEHMPARLRFTSVGYAYRALKSQRSDTASYAETVDYNPLDSRYVNEGQANSVDSGMINDYSVVRADVVTNFKAPYSDTADYARAGGTGPDNDWKFRVTDTADTTITTGGGWGIARYGNVLFGNADSTHVNLGVSCTTGTNGLDYKYCTVGGGNSNTASGRGATIGGGWKNTASGSYYPIIGGGQNNTASGSFSATVGGGQNNTVSGSYSTVAGGYDNSVSGGDATVGGGYGDTITAGGSYATVAGGYGNTASGSYTAIGGGYSNRTTNTVGTIAGGWENITSGSYASIGGGTLNNTAGDYSAIPGGKDDTLTSFADYSMAFGAYVYVNNPYTVIFFDSTYDGCLQINRDHHDASPSSTYPIRVGTSPANGNGAYLTKGGTWTDGSSRSKKENFEELDGAGVLDKIESMPVTRWNFKGMEERHIGPVAEDFYRAFGCGTGKPEDDSTYISAKDIAGVSLVAIQELSLMVKEQQKEIEILKGEIENMKSGGR